MVRSSRHFKVLGVHVQEKTAKFVGICGVCAKALTYRSIAEMEAMRTDSV